MLFGYPRKAGQFGVGHVLYGAKFNHEFSHHAEDRPTMGFWTKSRLIFNFIRDHAKASSRQVARQTGLSKSSVHRLGQARARRDRHPESWFWETEEGHSWLIRLVVATLYTFGLKRGVGGDSLSEFFCRLRLEAHIGCSLRRSLGGSVCRAVAAWQVRMGLTGRRWP